MKFFRRQLLCLLSPALRRGLMGAGMLAGMALAAFADAVVDTPVATFQPADPSRTYMDVGGAWNGTADVTNTTGDTFTVAWTNSGDRPAYDFSPVAVLPSGFNYVAGSAKVVTSPATPGLTVSASKSGQNLTFTLSPAGYDLPAGTTITLSYGLVTDSTVVSSTPQILYTRQFALSDGGALQAAEKPGQQNVAVRAFDSFATITPLQQSATAGDQVTFTVRVVSSGLGGIFDVLVNPSSFANLQFLNITKISPASPGAVQVGNGLRLPYLPPDGVFEVEVTASVEGCGTGTVTITDQHRTQAVADSNSATVQIVPLQPDLAYTTAPANVTLNYDTAVNVPAFTIKNNGAGAAMGVSLHSNLHTRGLTVTNVASGWTYNASTGVFTLTAGNGNLTSGQTASLSYTVSITDPCASYGGTVTYTPAYTNGCGTPIAIPQASHNFGGATNAPSIALSKEVSAPSIPYSTPGTQNSQGTYTLTLTGANIDKINTSGSNPKNVIVTDVLPANVVYLNHNASSGSGINADYNAGTRTVTWTVPVARLSSARTLTIYFAVLDDPCIANETVMNSASTNELTPTRGTCKLSSSASASFYIPTNPGPASSQSIILSGGTSPYETGNPDLAPIGTKGSAEGDPIPLRATYTFANNYLGTWTGSGASNTTYTDDLGGFANSFTIVANSVTISGTGPGAFGTKAVPPSAITKNASGLKIDLGFLADAGYFDDPHVAGRGIQIDYTLTAADSIFPNTSTSELGVAHHTILSLAAGGGGPTTCTIQQNNLFYQNTSYTVHRAAARISVSGPSAIDLCADNAIPLTITVSNANIRDARNLLVTLLVNSGSDYTYDAGQTPVYGGAFSSGNITYAANGGINPTFTYTGATIPSSPGSGTITVQVRRKSSAGTNPSGLSARVDYNSWQTQQASPPPRSYSATASYAPGAIRKATLNLSVSPSTITVSSRSVRYAINVFNSDSGPAYNSQVTSTIPLGFTVDTVATNAANASVPGSPTVSVSSGPGGRQVALWSLDTIASLGSRNLQIVLNVDDPDCGFTINPGVEKIEAQWGCAPDDPYGSAASSAHPSFSFPNGRIQVLHDASNTVARLCDPGKIIITIKNTGPVEVYGLVIKEIISDPSVLFIASGANKVRYRINNGSLQNLASATPGAGSTGNPYQWTNAQIPEFDKLVPVGAAGPNTISIEIELGSTENLAFASPVMTASGEAALTCGAAVLSPAQPFSIPVELPEVALTKTGRNLTAGQSTGAFSDNVYGGQGDTVEWRIQITNTGKVRAKNLRLSDALSGSGSSNIFLSTVAGSGGTSYTANSVVSLPAATGLDGDGFLPAGNTVTYYIRETLGSNCVTSSPAAKVSWGCDAPASGSHNILTSPQFPKATDTATLNMIPDIGAARVSQVIDNTLQGGRAKVTVTIDNYGGNAYGLVLTNTFPNTDMVLDMTVPPAVTEQSRLSGSPYSGAHTAPVTSITVNNTNPKAPVLTLSGAGDSSLPSGRDHVVRYMDHVVVTYYVRPASTTADTSSTTTFPDLGTTESGTARDPALPASGTNSIKLDYANGCGTNSSATSNETIDLLTPNLDITASSTDSVLGTADAAVTRTFSIQNVGDAGSKADFIRFKLRVGKGWSNGTPTVSVAGSTVSGAVDQGTYNEYTITLPTAYTLDRPAPSGNSPTITVTLPNAKVLNNNGQLILQLEAIGEARGQSGAADATPFNYSRDHRAIRTLGVDLDKTLVSTSEPDSSGATVLVGEEATFNISARFFGAETVAAPGGITAITLRDTPAVGASGSSGASNVNHRGLAYIGHVVDGSGITPGSTTAPTPIVTPANNGARSQNRVTFALPDISSTDTLGGDSNKNRFAATLTTRVLNVANNVNNKGLRNNLGMQLTYAGTTFRSDNADDEYTGNTASATLHKDTSLTVARPAVPTITKQLRNRGPDGTLKPAFATSITNAQAGDVIEYRITVTAKNSPAVPIFSLQVEDDVPAKVVLQPMVDGVHGYVADANVNSVVATPGGSITGNKITFNAGNLPFASAGSNLERLDNNKTVRFLYRGVLASAVNPEEVITNTAKVTAYSVPVDEDLKAPAQSAPQGVAAEGNGTTTQTAAFTQAATASASLTITPITIVDTQKRILTTSVGGDVSTTVLVGEQIRYEIGLILPQGTIPKLRVYDQLPQGLGLLTLESVEFGSAIDPSSQVQPSVSGVSGVSSTPATPATPAAGNPLNVQWDFPDDMLVNIGADADRTVRIRYVAQVRNIAANTRTTTLTNKAQYSFASGGSPAKTDITSVTATIAEPNITTTYGVRNATRNPTGSYATSIATGSADAPDAGDLLEYQVKITNATGATISTAYDLSIVDTMPEGVTYVDGWAGIDTATNVTPASFPSLEPDVNVPSRTLTWGRNQTTPLAIAIAPGGTLTFHYRVQVNDTSKPKQGYTNAVVVDWTSLEGAPGPDLQSVVAATPVIATAGDGYGERIGTGTAPNTYRGTGNTPVTSRDTSVVVKTKAADDPLPRKADDTAGDSPRQDGFRIGDIITFTVTATLQEGTFDSFKIEDTLPAGLAFIATDSITPLTNGGAPSEAQPIEYTTPTGTNEPAAGATGKLTWNFGDTVNTGVQDAPDANNGANNTLTIVYRARVVRDAVGTTPAATPVPPPTNVATSDVPRTNNAALGYKLFDGSAASRPASGVTFSVKQPLLTLTRLSVNPDPTLCNGDVLELGETGRYRLTIKNDGKAPAYNVDYSEVLPTGSQMAGLPDLKVATLNGTDVLSAITPTWNAGTREWNFVLADNQPLLPGQSLILEYTWQVGGDVSLRGQTLEFAGTINAYHSLPATESAVRRTYAAVGPETGEIRIGVQVSGFVYNDIEPNAHRDGFEEWKSAFGPTPVVYVSLVTGSSGTGTVCRTVSVASDSDGAYLLTRVAPESNFRLVVTNAPMSVGSTYGGDSGIAPAGWMFRAPSSGSQPITVTTVNLLEKNFGLYQGRGAITGVVFRDTGSGSNGNNGQQDGGEPGIPSVTVRLLKASDSSELATATTDGSGNFSLYVPDAIGSGTSLIIEETNPSGHISTGATLPGGVGATYNRAADRITFTYGGAPVGGFKFGDVPVNAFDTDGAQTILPGAVAFYRHTFTAGASGKVTFSVTDSSTPANLAWGLVILEDPGCNGTPGAVINGPVTVTAGQSLCIIVKVAAAPNAPYGAVDQAAVTATFEYTNSSPALPDDVLTRQDVTTIGTSTIAGLTLTKTVDKATAAPGAILTYTVTYTNTGVEPITDLFIDDRTPAYTVLDTVPTPTLPAGLTGCAITAGAGGGAPQTGEVTPLRWTFDGALPAGASGSVVFKVKVVE